MGSCWRALCALRHVCVNVLAAVMAVLPPRASRTTPVCAPSAPALGRAAASSPSCAACTLLRALPAPTRPPPPAPPPPAGSLVSNCVAGLSHGAGFVPGANVGENGAIFEQGTRHVGMDIAGRDEVNPTGVCV